MSFKDLKNSFLKKYYPIIEDMVLVFDIKEFSDESLIALVKEARKHVSQGFLFQTSGTTSEKKFVLHDYEAIKKSCETINDWVKASRKDKFISPISIHHMGGFSVLARCYFIKAEHEPIVMKSWDLPEYIRNIEQQKITMSSMVPSQIFEIVQQKQKGPASLQVVFVGGSALDQGIYHEALKLGWPLYKTFGSSEASSQIFTQKYYDKNILKSYFLDLSQKNSPSQHLDTSFLPQELNKTLFDENIYLLPHWNIKLSEEGHLMLKGTSLFKGYIVQKNKFEFQPLQKTSDDFFITEDRLVIKENQLEHFLGRTNDFIKINSSLVNLAALRKQFYQFCHENHIDAEHIVLSAKKDLKSGFYLVAISEIIGTSIHSTIEKWNQNHSAPERIRGIFYQKIPRTEIGKIKYALL